MPANAAGWTSTSASVGAAPHPPAGTFSPYSDGEKGAGRSLGALFSNAGDWRNRWRQRPSPRHYTGRGCRQAGEG
ncbi:MAG: hypothetical protein EOS38_33745, partial [Mesorhizobium sp.]